MSLTSKKTADVNTSAAAKAAQRARTASAATVASATSAAQNAAIAAQNAAAIAANAAQNAGGAAHSAASGMNKGVSGVKQGVYTARRWTAPRLEGVADYCTTTVAPKVSSALRSTARQVRPADASSSKRPSILTWSVLGAAILAALGAAAAMVRYRYRSAIAAESDAGQEVLGDSTGSEAAPVSPDGDQPATPAQDQDTETSVNGRVTTTGS